MLRRFAFTILLCCAFGSGPVIATPNPCCEAHETDHNGPSDPKLMLCITGEGVEECWYTLETWEYSARCPESICATTGEDPPHTPCGGQYVALKKEIIWDDCPGEECQDFVANALGCTGAGTSQDPCMIEITDTCNQDKCPDCPS